MTMDVDNHNISHSLISGGKSEERKVVTPLSLNEDTTNKFLFHDNICSQVPVGPLSPTAATDDSSETDIGNVLSLEVPDTPSNMSQTSKESEVEESSVVYNEWNLVHVSEPEKSIMLETVDVIDSVPSQMDCNPSQVESNRTFSPVQEDSHQGSDVGSSSRDLQALRRLQQDEAVKESNKEPFDPMRMLRKGGVAVLGGTITVVGLIMIPLPTPFGVVVASSGMAVLSSEFESAKVLNEKITETTKKHWDAARANIIKNIEEMEGTGRPSIIDGPDNKGSNDVTGNGESLKDETATATATAAATAAAAVNGDEVKQEQDAPRGNSPQPNIFDQWKRATGAYLSKNLVPILKRGEAEVCSVPDADITVQSETETISDMEQGDDLAGDSKYNEVSEVEAVASIAQQ